MSYIDIQPHDGWYDFSIEDFCDNICPHLGLDVSYKDVMFEGFWSQGDGASFEGRFFLTDVNLTDLKAACPTEVELHQLAEGLVKLAEAHHEIQGTINRMPSRYYHSNTMVIGDYSSNKGYCNEETEAFAASAETALLRIFRQLADWLYSRLESGYDYYLADATAQAWAEAVEERTSLQLELELLQADVASNPPKTLIQLHALNSAIAALEVEIEDITSTIDCLSDQFSYWPKDGNPYSIAQFYENHC